MEIIVWLLVILNIAAFTVFGIDKLKARQGWWRISESQLLGLALLGGSIGALMGMYIWHHKTKHWKFRIGLPVIFVVHIVCAVALSNCSGTPKRAYRITKNMIYAGSKVKYDYDTVYYDPIEDTDEYKEVIAKVTDEARAMYVKDELNRIRLEIESSETAEADSEETRRQTLLASYLDSLVAINPTIAYNECRKARPNVAAFPLDKYIKKILLQKHNIRWNSFEELNPNIQIN